MRNEARDGETLRQDVAVTKYEYQNRNTEGRLCTTTIFMDLKENERKIITTARAK